MQQAAFDAAPVLLDSPWQQVIGAYLNQVRQRSGSQGSYALYGTLLTRFLRGAGLDPLAGGDPSRVMPAMVYSYAYQRGRGGRDPAPSTVNVRLAVVSGFYRFAAKVARMGPRDEDGRLYNPCEDLQRPRVEQPPPKGLTPLEIGRLLEACPPARKVNGARDRALIITTVLTGLRRAEVLSLAAGDLVAGPGNVPMVTFRAKGGVIRHRELPLPALKAIRDYLAVRGTSLEQLPPDARLFPLTASGWFNNVRRYGRKAGIPDLSPHALRHSAAKLRRTTGASLEDVSALLGHKNLATTATYLRRLEGQRDDGWQPVAALLGLASE